MKVPGTGPFIVDRGVLLNAHSDSVDLGGD